MISLRRFGKVCRNCKRVSIEQERGVGGRVETGSYPSHPSRHGMLSKGSDARAGDSECRVMYMPIWNLSEGKIDIDWERYLHLSVISSPLSDRCRFGLSKMTRTAVDIVG